MRISLWMPDEAPEVFAMIGIERPDAYTLVGTSPDGDWRYTIQVIDQETPLLEERTLTAPARVLFAATYTRETPEGIDPASLMRGEAGWARLFSSGGTQLLDIVRIA